MSHHRRDFFGEQAIYSRLSSYTNENMAPRIEHNNLSAAKYLSYIPTQEELRREIEQQKEFYRLQNGG